MQNRLYISNLAGDVSASALQEVFEPHGFVTDVKLVAGREAPGTAFVIMATDDSALAAMSALNGTRLHGVELRVEVAREAAVEAWMRPEGGN